MVDLLLCTRCNRSIKAETAQQYNGMGKVCYEKSLKQVAELQDNPTLFEVVRDMQVKLNQLEQENQHLRKEVEQLKANPSAMIQPTMQIPNTATQIPPPPAMSREPVKVDTVQLTNNTPTDLSSAFFAVQDDIKAKLQMLRTMVDESSTTSMGTAAVEHEDTSGMEVLVAMQEQIKAGRN